MRLLNEIISTHPTSKGRKMRVREYSEKELEEFKERGVFSYDTCRIEWWSQHGLQIDVFVRPDELILLAQLLVTAYNFHLEDKDGR